jgi:hypothetical protein
MGGRAHSHEEKMSEIHQFDLVKGRVVPREARIVDTPLFKSKEIILSDLVPTDAIDEALIASIGTATYGAIDFANKPDPNSWSDYILRKISRDNQHSGFSRMWFTRNIPAADAAIPYRTETAYGDHRWHAVLYGVSFELDRSLPMTVQLADGSLLQTFRIVPIEDFTPAVDEGTLFTVEYFVGSEPFAIPQHEAPHPDMVSYVVDGVERTFERCLHKKLSLRPSRLGKAAPPQLKPATNFEDWDDYVKSDEAGVAEDLLHTRIKTTVTPPDKPPRRKRRNI